MWFGWIVASNPIPALWGKHKKKIIIGGVVVVVLWGFLASRDKPETVSKTIPDGYASAGRELFVHAPGDPSDPVPVVLVLHDDSSTAAEIERESDASKLADRQDFAVVYPEAVGGMWRVPDPRGADTQYLRDVVQYVSGEYKVDTKRVYIWGHGEGGLLALDAACSGTDRSFAAVAAVGKFEPAPAVACPAGVGKKLVPEEKWTEKITKNLWSFSKDYPGGPRERSVRTDRVDSTDRVSRP
jgi:polyhydroxybutyrate depolymerase